MPLPKTKVGEMCGQMMAVKWSIEKYFQLSKITDNSFRSPSFVFENTEWNLIVYPDGEVQEGTMGWLGLYLKAENFAGLGHAVKYEMGIGLNFESKHAFHKGFILCSEPQNRWGTSKLISVYELKRRNREIAPKGTLTIFCYICEHEMKVIKDAGIQTTESEHEIKDVGIQTTESLEMLVKNFKDLFLTGRHTDVTIRVKNEEFHAHKFILESRSPVFAAMFQHNMKENNSGIITINDCDSREIQDLLLYLYTGKLERFSPSTTMSLYSVADKYDIKELKTECVDILMSYLTVDTACDVIIHAEKYGEKKLKNSAKSIIAQNMKEIISTDKWQNFVIEQPGLVNEIILEIISDDWDL